MEQDGTDGGGQGEAGRGGTDGGGAGQSGQLHPADSTPVPGQAARRRGGGRRNS